jgi:hypothetical protein
MVRTSLGAIIRASIVLCFALLLLSQLLSGLQAATSTAWEAPRFAQAPTMDGNLSEWRKLAPMRIGLAKRQVVGRYNDRADAGTLPDQWYGPLDFSVLAWAGWDENYFYFAAEINDDIFVQEQNPDNIWRNDCIQLAFDPKLDRAKGKFAEDDREYWWARVDLNTVGYCYQGPITGERRDFNAVVALKSGGDGWTFEVAIPWQELKLEPKGGL